MSLYQIREAIRTETNESRITELIIQRDKLIAEEPATHLTYDQWYAGMLDSTFN